MPTCMTWIMLAALLEGKYKEELISIGKSGTAYIAHFVGEDSWSIVSVDKEGKSCIVAAGTKLYVTKHGVRS